MIAEVRDAAVRRSGALYLAVFVLTLIAGVETAGPARAGSTATRCDVHGCAHIHCSSTGDRCYRYADGPLVGRDHYLPQNTGSGSSHRVCDTDRDRCYLSPGQVWIFAPIIGRSVTAGTMSLVRDIPGKLR